MWNNRAEFEASHPGILDHLRGPQLIESIKGQVIKISDTEVTVRFDPGLTKQDVFDEDYAVDKFNGKLGEQYQFTVYAERLI